MQREVVAQCGEINAHDPVPGHSQAPSMLLPTRVMLTTERRSHATVAAQDGSSMSMDDPARPSGWLPQLAESGPARALCTGWPSLAADPMPPFAFVTATSLWIPLVPATCSVSSVKEHPFWPSQGETRRATLFQ